MASAKMADVEIDMPRVHRQRRGRLKELDAQRAEECALVTEAQEHAQSHVRTVVHPPESRERVTTLHQMANMLQSERIRPVAKKQTHTRRAGSRCDPPCPIPMMPQYVPNDVTNWLQDRQTEQHEALLQ